MSQPRRRLSDILSEGQQKNIFQGWEQVKAAEDFAVLPAGTYEARITDAYPSAAKTGTGSFKLVFQVVEGQHAGRRLWHDLWVTEKAKPQLKRDCQKLGITDPARQFDDPATPAKLRRLRCKLTVVVQQDDAGNPSNKVRAFEVVGIEPLDEEPFAPAPPANSRGTTGPAAPAGEQGPADRGPSASGQGVTP
jgi:hypothetical protein